MRVSGASELHDRSGRPESVANFLPRFDAAADHMAMLTADRLHEYAGRERGVAIDLTAEKVEAFRTAVAALFP
jgi:hypothetical protein